MMNDDLGYVYEQTLKVIYGLAVGAGCIHDRLISVATDALTYIDHFAQALPPDLRAEYRQIMRDLAAHIPPSERRIEVSITLMTDDEAVGMAHRLHEFASRVAAVYRGER